MKETRKLLCFVLTLVMVLCMFPVTSQAAELPSGDGWSMSVTGTLTITSDAGMNDWTTNRSAYGANVKSVVIGDNVHSISNEAFISCQNLESAVIGASVTTIGAIAFSSCTSLGAVTIGDSVKTIGNGAFNYCTELVSVNIPDSVTTIGNSAFYGCYGIINLTLGDSVTTISAAAFKGCTGLVRVTIGDSVDIIGNDAFSDDTSLKSVLFSGTTPPSTVGTTVFDNATTLAGIYVPADSVDAYKTKLADYESLVKPISVAITKNRITTYYPTLTNALAAAQSGDTVTLLSDITESTIYTISADTTVTIDGMGHIVTGVDDDTSFALTVDGDGTLWLKNITLQGGTASKASGGLMVGGGSQAPGINVFSIGTVTVLGGEGGNNSFGVGSNSTGSVFVTTASGSSDVAGASNAGAANYGSGTINVGTATASGSGNVTNFGVWNRGVGTINVNKAEAIGASDSNSYGAYNMSNGIINAATATGTTYGVRNISSGAVNVTTATGGGCGAWNDETGTVNVGTATATELGKGKPLPGVHNAGTGTINTGATVVSVAAITLNKGTGATCVLDSITVASTGTSIIGKLPSVYKDGVYSDLWYTDSAKTTTFTGITVTGATTLYSYFYTLDTGDSGGHHSGGSGSGTTSTETPKIETTVSGNTATVSIPQAALGQTVNGGTDAFKVSTAIASLTFDKAALSTIKDAASDIKITATKVDTAGLSEETKQLVGDRPVFDFSVTGGNKTISQFGGTVTVSVPYTPKAGEDSNAIVIYYINAEGKPEMVSNCSYDPATGSITFTTDHFSKYAVGYNKVNFSDVAANAWYGSAVSFVAARDITTGTGNGNFSPMEKLTRGQFLVMVMRAYGIAANSASTDNFSDAGNTYYTGYLAAAKSLGITDGIGNNLFAPKKEITRQEMFTLLYNTLKQIDALPESTTGKTLTSYQDADKIASWAEDAMKLFVGTGTISGSGEQLKPTDTTNRAQMAQVLYNLLSK